VVPVRRGHAEKVGAPQMGLLWQHIVVEVLVAPSAVVLAAAADIAAAVGAGCGCGQAVYL